MYKCSLLDVAVVFPQATMQLLILMGGGNLSIPKWMRSKKYVSILLSSGPEETPVEDRRQNYGLREKDWKAL